MLREGRFLRFLAGSALLIGGVSFLVTVGAQPSGADGAPATPAYWGEFTANNSHAPATISPASITLPGSVVEVATNANTDYALLSNGTVYAWGYGSNGEFGDGNTVNLFTTAVKVVFPADVKITSLPTDALPYEGGLAIDSNGNAWGWGLNSAGYLCLGNTTEQLVPVQLPFSDVTAMTGQSDHTTYDAGGTVYSCGGNANGVLGNGTTRASTTPVKVSNLPTGQVVFLASSWENTGALLANGTYLDWGYNAQGQLGDGQFGVSSWVPVRVPLPLPVTQVFQGGSNAPNGQTLAILSDGSLRAWGNDSYGQLGDGKTSNEASPITIFPPLGVTYRFLASGGATSFAISTSGQVYSWGKGIAGEIGNGSRVNELTPVPVASGVSQISTTAEHTVALVAMTIAPASLSMATVNKAYTATLDVAGGSSPYTWTLSSGALPAGLALSPSGKISGTPTQAGISSFTVEVTDSSSPALTATGTYPVRVTLGISPGSFHPGTVSTPYANGFAAAGGSSPYTWTLSSGALPAGLALSPLGKISGTPTQAGTSSFRVEVTDSSSPALTAVSRMYQMRIAMAISPGTFPPGNVGQPYAQNAAAAGGSAPYTWTLSSGALPAGLALSPSGTISGTPTQAGTSSFTVEVTDSSSPALTATRTCTLRVH